MIHFAEKHGVYENFGDEQYRAIKDKYKVGLSYSEQDKHNMIVLKVFGEWCSHFAQYNPF